MNQLETTSAELIHIPETDPKVLKKLAAVVGLLAAVIARLLCIVCEKL